MNRNRQTAVTLHGDARRALVRGVDAVADMVKVTLGPRGKNIVIERVMGYPLITKDGVTVAKHIELPDTRENMGARLCRDVAVQTNDLAGDGTTTSIVLTQALIKEGLRLIEAGFEPVRLQQALVKAAEDVIAAIMQASIPADSYERICQVAASASKNTRIGELVGQAIIKAGPHGIVDVHETNERNTYVEVTDGLELDSGYISSYLVSAEHGMMLQLENPLILITDSVLNDLNHVKRVLNICEWQKKPLLMVAAEITRDVLGMIIAHNDSKEQKVAVVKAPGYGQNRLDLLEDLALMTGAVLIAEQLGLTVERVQESMLGQAKSVTVMRHKTVILEGNAASGAKESRLKSLNVLMRQTSDPEEQAGLQQRLAKLGGGIAVIRVGADTEMALRELKDRVVDAVNAARAAVESGIVPGGGTALVRAAAALEPDPGDSDVQAAAKRLLKNVVEAPLRQIVFNTGGNPERIVEQAKRLNGSIGYNALTQEFEDLVQSGIVDPAKVTVTALRSAVGVAAITLTAEGLIERSGQRY